MSRRLCRPERSEGPHRRFDGACVRLGDEILRCAQDDKSLCGRGFADCEFHTPGSVCLPVSNSGGAHLMIMSATEWRGPSEEHESERTPEER